MLCSMPLAAGGVLNVRHVAETLGLESVILTHGKKYSEFCKSYVFFNFKLFLFNGNLDFLFFSLI